MTEYNINRLITELEIINHTPHLQGTGYEVNARYILGCIFCYNLADQSENSSRERAIKYFGITPHYEKSLQKLREIYEIEDELRILFKSMYSENVGINFEDRLIKSGIIDTLVVIFDHHTPKPSGCLACKTDEMGMFPFVRKRHTCKENETQI